jgi:hypothetical protein
LRNTKDTEQELILPSDSKEAISSDSDSGYDAVLLQAATIMQVGVKFVF